jgi:alpha-D-xyloside xylohydrolase
MRWTQFGVFTSHIRYHGTNKREPWHYPAIAPLVKKWWKLRYSLIPYIVEQSKLAIESGYPLLQALILHHPEDKLCWHIDDEYYFGNDFLVAPVMNSGELSGYLSSRRKMGETSLRENVWKEHAWLKDVYVPLEEMPVYVRENAVIPIYPEDVDCTDEMDLSKSIALRIDNDYKGFWKR